MDELKILNIGEKFMFKGYEWVCLDKDDEGIFAITTNFWQSMPFDVDNHNNWEKSSLRRVLNSEFLDIIGRENLVKIKSDLVADNGDKTYGATEDYITILSCDQYRKYRDVVPRYSDDYMWTLTPWSCNSGNGGGVRAVNPTGDIYYGDAYIAYGVAPACKFSSAHLKLCRQAQLVEVDENV